MSIVFFYALAVAPVEYFNHLKSLDSEKDLHPIPGAPNPIEITENSRPVVVAGLIRDALASQLSEMESPLNSNSNTESPSNAEEKPPKAVLHARGMAAINQAVKAVAVARKNWITERETKAKMRESYVATAAEIGAEETSTIAKTEGGEETGVQGNLEKLGSDLTAYVRMHPREELTWACTLEVVPFTPEPEPPLQLGEIIEYNSSTHGVWIPGEVVNINEDGTVDLNIREEADPARIRRLMEELRVARTSEPDLVAKTISSKLKHGQALMLAAIGPSSVHAAILGIALGSLYLQEEEGATDIGFRPEFTTIELGSSGASSKLVTLRIILDANLRDERLRPPPKGATHEENKGDLGGGTGKILASDKPDSPTPNYY